MTPSDEDENVAGNDEHVTGSDEHVTGYGKGLTGNDRLLTGSDEKNQRIYDSVENLVSNVIKLFVRDLWIFVLS